MPNTSSAVPAHLARFARSAEAAGAGARTSATNLDRAAVALVSSRSVGLAGIDLVALGGRLHRHADRALALADRVGDVGQAFALAGDPVGLAVLVGRVREVVEGRIDDFLELPLEGVLDWIRVGMRGPLDPFDLVFDGADRALRWFPLTSGVPPVSIVVTSVVTALAPQGVAALLLDLEATPPPVVASVLDEVLAVEPPMADPPASYYVAMLVDGGYLRGLPTSLAEAPGAVPRLPGD